MSMRAAYKIQLWCLTRLGVMLCRQDQGTQW